MFSGLAAGSFLAERGDLRLATSAGENLAAELAAWQDEQGPRGSDPAAFVQSRWHGENDADYRAYVTDVLAKEGVPDKTDFERAVQESLQRLRQGRDSEARRGTPTDPADATDAPRA